MRKRAGRTAGWVSQQAGAEPMFLALEPRQHLSAGPALSRLLSMVTTTGATAAITAPEARTRVFGYSAGAGTIAAARSLMALDAFAADARFAGINGSGFSTVILDTGINLLHPFFGPDADGNGVADRILYQYDFADMDANASDRDGHGSNVASIAASSDSVFTGAAPGAGIIVLKVFSDNGSGTFAAVERALQWVISHVSQYNIASVNMSLGDSGNYNSQAPRYGLGDELAVLAAMNVIVATAAGNSFYEHGSQLGVSYPASDPNTLAVGAVYAGNYGGFMYSGPIAHTTGADRITPFSQRSVNVPTIFAPGAPIGGAGLGPDTLILHGTSQAAPQIAGIAVLAQQMAVQFLGRRLTPGEFRSMLVTSGDTIFDGDDEDDNVLNSGRTFRRADVLALGNAILNLVPPAAPPGNRAPTLTGMLTLTGGRPNRPGLLGYDLLRAAGNEHDADGDTVQFRIASHSGLLIHNGSFATPGQTLVRPGDWLIWLPPRNATGVVTAFSVTAFDGYVGSSTPVAVRVEISARLALGEHVERNGMSANPLTIGAQNPGGTAAAGRASEPAAKFLAASSDRPALTPSAARASADSLSLDDEQNSLRLVMQGPSAAAGLLAA